METLNRHLIGNLTRFKRAGIVRLVMMMLALFMVIPVSAADAETRKLKLYFLHTGERAEITFKKNGRYVQSGLTKINRFLRDWRRNEPTKMNPRLLDLIWEVYQETGSRKYIHVISGYRSPATNSLLRKRGRGVATKSQHTLGNALDFFIPGVSLRQLRNIGLRKGLGGVGYYPKSGSPFVHMDTGRVRHWPRMSRSELVKVFPKGKTLHVPTDGKPLPGYNIAKANYERALKGKSSFSIASAEDIQKKPGILQKLFARDDDDDEGSTDVTATPKPVTPQPVKPAATPQPVAPEPAAPVANTPETIIASLPPSQIPVPVLAPRIAIAKPEDIVREPTQVAVAVPVENPVEETVEATVEEALVEETAQQELAFNVPIPSPALRPPAPVLPPVVVAEAQPEVAPRPAVEVAALSPNEISDLRKQVYAAIKQPVAPAQNTLPENSPFKPATPVTGTQITGTQVTGTQIATAEPVPAQAPAPIDIPFNPPTALTQNDVPSLIQSASSAIDQQFGTSNAQASIEPGIQQTGSIAVPAAKPETRSTLVTALLPDQAATEPQSATAATVNVPVPQKASRPQIIVPEPINTGVANSQAVPAANLETQKVAKLTELEFKKANLDTRLTGKWALANDASIKDIADINPPAYARNAIIKTPSRVLARGFAQDNLGKRTGSFAGSSLEFLDFKSFGN